MRICSQTFRLTWNVCKGHICSTPYLKKNGTKKSGIFAPSSFCHSYSSSYRLISTSHSACSPRISHEASGHNLLHAKTNTKKTRARSATCRQMQSGTSEAYSRFPCCGNFSSRFFNLRTLLLRTLMKSTKVARNTVAN